MLHDRNLEEIPQRKSKSRRKSKKHRRQTSLNLNCELCDLEFDKHFELEQHIKCLHETPEGFECQTCKKKFVTEWRLRKHEKSHPDKIQTHCRYFNNKVYCPFEELGGKFGHDPSENDDDQDRSVTVFKKVENDRVIAHDTSDENYSSFTTEENYNVDPFPFYTSTPKKTLPCEECLDKSECVDCLVNHILGKHEVARLMFSPSIGRRAGPYMVGIHPIRVLIITLVLILRYDVDCLNK